MKYSRENKEIRYNKFLLLEILVFLFSVSIIIVSTALFSKNILSENIASFIIVLGLVPLVLITLFMIKLEIKEGYYKCKNCGNSYLPSYWEILFSPHIGRNRYLKCPHCNKRTWNKKKLF